MLTEDEKAYLAALTMKAEAEHDMGTAKRRLAEADEEIERIKMVATKRRVAQILESGTLDPTVISGLRVGH